MKIASESGADCIEWSGDIHIKDVTTAKHARKLCDDAGIMISSYGSYYRVGSKNADDRKNICEIANALGTESIRVWPGNHDSEITDDETYKLLDKIISSDFEGNLLIEYTYLFFWAGIPSSMKKDIAKIKAKAGTRK